LNRGGFSAGMRSGRIEGVNSGNSDGGCILSAQTAGVVAGNAGTVLVVGASVHAFSVLVDASTLGITVGSEVDVVASVCAGVVTSV